MIATEEVELHLPLSSFVKQWMHCAGMTGVATNTPSTTLGSRTVFFITNRVVFFAFHVIQSLFFAPLSPLSLSTVLVYWSRREHRGFGRRGHGGRRSFSGGQR